MLPHTTNKESAKHHEIPQWRQERLKRSENMKDEDRIHRYKGILYPTVMCARENLEALGTLEARREDVVLVSYPKSGGSSHASTVCPLYTPTAEKLMHCMFFL